VNVAESKGVENAADAKVDYYDFEHFCVYTV